MCAPLLRLPGEIRDKIWAEVLGDRLIHFYLEPDNKSDINSQDDLDMDSRDDLDMESLDDLDMESQDYSDTDSQDDP